MGINGLLPRILPSAGRENYDLRSLKDGIISFTDAPQNNYSNEQPPHSKRRKRTNDSDDTTTTKTWTRRKVRIAVDVNGWISRAAHGYGGELVDEKQFSYHGRNQLKTMMETSGGEKDMDGLANEVVVDNDNNYSVQQQQNQQKRRDYIQRIVSYTLHKIESMRDECSVLVLPVLDGNTPPCKLEVVKERSARRGRAEKDRDEMLSSDGKDAADDTVNNEAARTEAKVFDKISKSKRGGLGKDYTLRRDLLAELLSEFRRRKFPFLVAPYEADSQLSYLSNTRAVDVVVTEDSDLIGLGVPTLIYKLGGWNGNNNSNRGGFTTWSSSSHLGTMLHRRDLGAAHGIDLLDFTDAMLVTMFVAAGCDYCESLKGIGVVTARNIVKKAFHGQPSSEEPALRLVLNSLFQGCSKDARGKFLPLDDPSKEEARLAYERKFLVALAMYRHPLVYDPIAGMHLIANDVSGGNESRRAYVNLPTFQLDEQILMEFEPYKKLVTNRERLYEVVGSPSAPEIAKGIAEGFIDPRQLSQKQGDDGMEIETQQGEGEGESSTQPSSEMLSSQEFSRAGTQQSKFSQSSTSDGLSSPDLLNSPFQR